MGKWAKGVYQIKNKEKYMGKKMPIYRSSWEHTFMMFLDNHESVISWNSEGIKIRYKDPVSGKMKNYIPDFLIIFEDKFGVRHGEIVEIKPKNQCQVGKSRSKVNQAQAIRNQSKWKSCEEYAAKNGLTFRVLTEDHLFGKK